MTDRFALYYAPPTTHPLWLKAAQWLGRDPAGSAVTPAATPPVETAARLAASASARRYGFHATIKAPMALAEGVLRTQLEDGLAAFGAAHAPATIGRLELRFIDGFLALLPVEQSAAFTRFAGEVVTAFEPLRAPLTPTDRDKRVAGGHLTPAQVDLLDRYGYPYVMDEFRFHMTLTDRLPEAARPDMLAAAQSWFGEVLAEPYVMDRIVLFHEAVPGAPFTRERDFLLTGAGHD